MSNKSKIVKELKIERPPRAEVSTKEAIERMKKFAAERKEKFIAAVRENKKGSYLSRSRLKTPDRINLIYTDIPIGLSTNFELIEMYAEELKRAAFEALSEEVVLVVVKQVYHAV